MIYKLKKIFARRKKIDGLEEVFSEYRFKDFTAKAKFESRFGSRIDFSGLNFLYFGVVLVSAVFLVQVYNLQIVKGEEYAKKSAQNQFVYLPVLPQRGRIIDRNEVVLAETIKKDPGTTTNILENNFYRKYTNKEGLSHILGYVKYPQKDDKGIYWQNNFEGVSGLEAFYNQLLSGLPGKRIFEKTADHNLQTSFVVEPPVEGKDIQISLDSELNEYAHKKLRSFVNLHSFTGGSIVIMDIETGEVIVMTNYPEYKIEKLVNDGEDTPEEKKERQEYLEDINKDKRTPMLNRAIAGTYAPGSTMKTVFALAGLQLGLIDPITSIYSAGFIEIPNVVDPTKKNIFRDWKAHCWVNVRTALANSSDVFFYAIGGGYEDQKGMGIKKIDEYSKAFGVDSLTGIDIGGERTGNIPTPEWKKKVFKEDWYLGDTYISSIGQFGFLVTPVALTRLTAAIANGGYLITPKLRMDSNPIQKKKVAVDIESEHYDVVRDGMRMVITNGTGKSLNSTLLEIAGKSGTAEVGVKKDKIQSWITGYFPYKKPRYAFTVLCEMGIRDVSPTPNRLARDVIEKMYLTNEYYRNIEGKDLEKKTEIEEVATTTTSQEEIISR
jgi:penicillin-binding protein 2